MLRKLGRGFQIETDIERLYGGLLSAVPDPVVLYDITGSVAYANAAFESLYGWRFEDLKGRRIDFVPADEVQKSNEATTKSLAGESVALITRRFDKAGRLIEVYLTTAPIFDKQKNIVGIFVFHRDITRQADESLLGALMRYRNVIDASQDPIAIYNGQGKISYVNQAFEGVFGWGLTELSGQGVDFIPEEELEKTIDAVKRTIQGEQVILETRRKTRSGSVLDIILKTARFTDAEGNFTGDVVFYRDVTKERQFERELSAHKEKLEEMVAIRTGELKLANRKLEQAISEQSIAENELRASRARFKELVDLLPEIVFEAGIDGHLTYVNKTGLELYGWTEDDVKGRNIMYFLDEKECVRAQENMRNVLGGQPSNANEYAFKGRDGAPITVIISSSAIMSEGKPVGIRGVITDITRLKEMEVRLGHSAKMEAVGTLAGGIAHDFNNILQAISGYLQLVLEAGDVDVLSRERLSHAETAAMRASDLVRSLLAFSRKGESRFRPLNINEEIKLAVSLLERTIPKMVRISFDPGYDLPMVFADPSQISQVILNIGTNARDAMPEGGTLKISTSLFVADEALRVQVPELLAGKYILITLDDNGLGMDAQTVRHIFEPFYTTKAVGKGTGLGLSTVYGIVKGHGGYISCQSAPGKGTRFFVYLPVVMVETKSVREADPNILEDLQGDETILMADDDDNVLELAFTALSHFGYQVVTANSGEEVLELYRANPNKYDLVILDLGMPGMGGLKALEELKKLSPGLKVMVASGYSRDREALNVEKAGAARFVPKPYRLRELAQAVREVLNEEYCCGD